MVLSAVKIVGAHPREAPYKIYDEKGLYLLVQPTGGKLWRLKYRYLGKEKKLSLGVFPDTTLKSARQRRDDARGLLSAGVDPGEAKRAEQQGQVIRAANTFQAVAEEYIAKKEMEGLAVVTLSKARWLLKLFEKESLGTRSIAEIRAPELLEAIRGVEQRGNLETAWRMRSFAGRVFRYGIATGRAERDPSHDIRDALTAPQVTHRAALLNPREVGALLRKIDGCGGTASTKYALQMLPHVFVRPGELRSAEWVEFELQAAVWTVPAEKTKMRKPHAVPLSRQILELLGAAHEISGRGRYVFPSPSVGNAPICENTLNNAPRRLGYSKEQMTSHGFRSTASTLLNASGKWNPDAIERALGHGQENGVRAAYNRDAYWDERVRMAQWWSDYLDTLKKGRE